MSESRIGIWVPRLHSACPCLLCPSSCCAERDQGLHIWEVKGLQEGWGNLQHTGKYNGSLNKAVNPQGPGYAETRGQPTLKMSQWFTKTHGCILRNRGGYTAAAGGDAHGARVSRSTDSKIHRGHLDNHRYMSTHIHIHARCTHTHTAYQLCNPGTSVSSCHGGSMVVIHEDRESAECLCPSDTSV